MTDRMEWVINQEGGVTRVALRGSVDEDADFAGLLKQLEQPRRVRFDLGGIARINSCGVREWVNFLRSLPAGGSVELERCSPVVVSQINMISNFAGAAQILSVMAPFVCDPCGHEENVLLSVQRGTIPELGAVQCPKCGSEMDFDDVEDSYFAFLS